MRAGGLAYSCLVSRGPIQPAPLPGLPQRDIPSRRTRRLVDAHVDYSKSTHTALRAYTTGRTVTFCYPIPAAKRLNPDFKSKQAGRPGPSGRQVAHWHLFSILEFFEEDWSPIQTLIRHSMVYTAL